MEKSRLLEEPDIQRQTYRIRSKLRVCAALVLAVLGIGTFVFRDEFTASRLIPTPERRPFSWNDVSLHRSRLCSDEPSMLSNRPAKVWP